MISHYCLAHCLTVAFDSSDSFIATSLTIYIMLSSTTEQNITGIAIQQLFAILGYIIYILCLMIP